MNSTLIHVKRKENQDNSNLISTFIRRVKNSGVVKRAKATKFSSKPLSKILRRRKAVKVAEYLERMEYYRKIGRR